MSNFFINTKSLFSLIMLSLKRKVVGKSVKRLFLR